MIKFWRAFFLSFLIRYVDEPSLSSTPPVAPVVNDPPKDPPVVNDPPKGPPVVNAPAAPKAEDVTAATEFLSKNVDGFDPKDKKPEEIMALRGAFDVFTANEARKYLKSSGVKAEDVAKMSPADAIKAAEEARAKPAEYGEFKLPEGMQKDEVLDKTFREWAGKNKVPAAAAQEIVTAYVTRLAEVMQQPVKLWQDTQKNWREEISKDPVIGGDKLPQNLAGIGKMIDQVAGEGAKPLREALDATGFGNHPAGVRFFHALSQFFVEGGPLHGKGPVTLEGDKQNPASKLYPGMPSDTAAAG